MILTAMKGPGESMHTCYAYDPFKKFEETYGAPALFTPVEGKESGIAAITHKQPDFDFGVNLELYGTLLYGPVMIVNVGDDGMLTSLTEKQLQKLRDDAGLSA